MHSLGALVAEPWPRASAPLHLCTTAATPAACRRPFDRHPPPQCCHQSLTSPTCTVGRRGRRASWSQIISLGVLEVAATKQQQPSNSNRTSTAHYYQRRPRCRLRRAMTRPSLTRWGVCGPSKLPCADVVSPPQCAFTAGSRLQSLAKISEQSDSLPITASSCPCLVEPEYPYIFCSSQPLRQAPSLLFEEKTQSAVRSPKPSCAAR